MTTTKTEAEIRAEVLATMQANIDRLERELANNVPGSFVHYWPKHSLGIKVGAPNAVCVSLATITDVNDKRQWSNGAGTPTVLTDRAIALTEALERSRESLAHITKVLDEQALVDQRLQKLQG